LGLRGSSGWYEGWAAGDWSSPDPVPIFDLFVRNAATLGAAARAKGPARWMKRLGHAARRNHRRGSRRNIAAHYDLGNDFYAAWLDGTMTYSAAMFTNPDEPLEAAQRRKLDAALARTGAGSGDSLLEIGCGWGSFAETARAAGVLVDAITLSPEQARIAAERVGEGSRVTLTDYRDVPGTYDAVVSIEMAEAVGERYWPDYVAAIARALRPGGCAALQFITVDEAIFPAYRRGVDFIQRYVFPGGLLLSERRLRTLCEAAGLDWRDPHRFGGDYAETLRRWREGFDMADAEGRLPDRLDARFRALWRYYLMYCEGGFRGGGIDVMQVTLVKRS
jgi:cyclopropane-fatty-acyl-phospholipid synthase